MTRRTSGFDRDARLIRRRAWLFIPFLILGIAVALFYHRVAGETNAIGTMAIETVVHEVYPGGDRGFRTFEADQMTKDPVFKQEVIAAIGDPNFNYARFGISLVTVSIGDGVASGTETVAIRDANPLTAEKYRNAFVNVFTKEFTSLDGLFRRSAVAQRQAVANAAEANYLAGYAQLVAMAKAKGITVPVDQLANPNGDRSVIQGLNLQEAGLLTELAQVQGAESTIAAGANVDAAKALASSILQTAVAGDPATALKAKETALNAALASIRSQRSAMSDGSFDAQFLALVDDVRARASVKNQANLDLNDAKAATASIKTDIETTYTQTGGQGSSLLGRIAIVLAITIVFGLIAIYAWEWLGQVRSAISSSEK